MRDYIEGKSRDEINEFIHGMHLEFNEIHDTLAKALGYHYDEDYGYATGDHSPLTLAMETKGEIKRARELNQTRKNLLDIYEGHYKAKRGDITFDEVEKMALEFMKETSIKRNRQGEDENPS